MTARTGTRQRPQARWAREGPARRDRLVDTALDVIAAKGVAATTHRAVATAAEVPLGSVTYYFESLDELLFLAFTKYAESCADRFDRRMESASTPAEAQEAVVQTVVVDYGSTEGMILAYELYVAAARRPRLRDVMQAWMERSQTSLRRHFSPEDARALDAFVEGLIVHGSIAARPMTEQEVREAVQRLTATLVTPAPSRP